MNIFKKKPEQGTAKDSQNKQESSPKDSTKLEELKQNPHESGGCCGSCGGQEGQGL